MTDSPFPQTFAKCGDYLYICNKNQAENKMDVKNATMEERIATVRALAELFGKNEKYYKSQEF